MSPSGENDSTRPAPRRRQPPVKRGAGSHPPGIEQQLRHVQRLAMQGELAATAVHEISNLLTIVLFNAGLLRERHAAHPEEIKYIEPLLYAATSISTLCSQLRNLARPPPADPRVIDLVETTRGTFRLLEQIIMRELVFAPAISGEALVRADPAHLDQILVNLVLNARDATSDENGRITVRIGSDPARPGFFIEVQDNGSGMTAGVQKKLFTPFFTTKPMGQGTGLGLVTVRRLTEAIGGHLTVSSQPGKGTSLRLQFPPPDPAELVRYHAEIAATKNENSPPDQLP